MLLTRFPVSALTSREGHEIAPEAVADEALGGRGERREGRFGIGGVMLWAESSSPVPMPALFLASTR
jgi:hypothetical protein